MITEFQKLIILYLIVFLILIWKNKTSAQKKAVGSVFIAMGIGIISPPYPSIIDNFAVDGILFSWFMKYKGINNLPEMISSGAYTQFILLSIILGIILIYMGMRIADIDIKNIKRRIGL